MADREMISRVVFQGKPILRTEAGKAEQLDG
jgi:hypothetical protein